MQVPPEGCSPLFLLIENAPHCILGVWSMFFLWRWKMQLRHLFAGIVLTAGCLSGPAKATIFYVAINGDDNAICYNRSTPCLTVFGAVSQATPGDAVICLTPTAGFSIPITKSIDIDCSSARHHLNAGSTGLPSAAIRIDIPVSANDPARTVRIRGLSITGDTVFPSRGIEIVSAASVHLEEVVIAGAGNYGILDRRTGGQSRLYVTDSIIRN